MFFYKLVNINLIENKGFYFKNIKFHEINKIRVLRNKYIEFLRQNENLSIKKQFMYFFSKVRNSTLRKKPEMIIFSIYRKYRFIGYGGFVHINWNKKSAELSYLAEYEFSNLKKNHHMYFKIFLENMKSIAKNLLKFKTLSTETFMFRSYHIKILEQSNFKLIKKKINKKNFISSLHEYKI